MTQPVINPPFWLLAELTYRCPLHCVFCYNPVNYDSIKNELDTDAWIRVMREARALGAAQIGFSGGEPLLRDDLDILVAEARRLGFYTNLITSGVGLNEKRIASLKQAGLDHIQLSFQDSTKEMNDFLSSTKTFELKKKVAALIGGIAGAIFTRIPYMEDGNLLVTSVIVIVSALVARTLWVILQKTRSGL